MADPALYPLPAFSFTVDWSGSRVGFTEITGLTKEIQPIEYRDGSFREATAIKMPGLIKYPNLVLKRGILNGDDDFNKWLMTVNHNTVERRDLTIKLLNEKFEPVMVWKIMQAFPVKVEGPGLKSTGNEVAIETIELTHEGLEISLG